VEGYSVTVFEALPVAGGMLRVGVPEYRLPTEIIEREVQDILDLGIELRLNACVDNLDDVFREGFDAVLIAVGAHEGVRLPIPGANLDGVLLNTSFLRDVRLGEPLRLGERVAVVGAGDVAMDVARTAVRLGAQVHLYYRRTKAEATADEEEMHHAVEEGIVFHWQTTPIEVIGNQGRVTGLKCVRTEQGLPDETGRRRPVPIPGSEHVVPCNNVIFSVGQRAGLAFIPESVGVGVTSESTIAINPNTFAATRPGVFAAGDATTGTAFVIEAVEAGHRAAESIHRYLRGEELEPAPMPRLPVVELTHADIQAQVTRGELEPQPRVPMDRIPVHQRLSTFDEVVAGYSNEQAQAEAARCLACGICSECLSCEYICEAQAVDHDMTGRVETIDVGALVLAPGFIPYPAERSQEYGFGRYRNVVTSLQFERLLSASGPTFGHVRRPADGEPARKIAFLQCVGSRDQDHDYCSSICCMSATKEAIMAVEHDRDTEVHIFMMDVRAFSKGYEEYFGRAVKDYGIRFTRCRVSAVKENPVSRNLIIRYVAEATSSFPSLPVEEEFDLVVLSIGMEMSEGVRELGQRLGIELDDHGFCHTAEFYPLQTSRPGVYAIGPFREPKDIPDSVVEASGAATMAGTLLNRSRWALIKDKEYPLERDPGEDPRVGVFVCHCGSNIGGFLDVPAVAEYARSLPGVVHSENNLYTCSQDSITQITERIEELGLNRVVVAACTPLTHEPLFQDSLRTAGLNPYLFEMANIRNQCSWVHSDDWEGGTGKARDLVRMAVARANHLESLTMSQVSISKRVLVIGGGPAGMNAALSLASQEIAVTLVEREANLGGNLRNLRYLRSSRPGKESNLDPEAYLLDLVERVEAEPLIKVCLETELVSSTGFKGNFSSTLKTPDSEFLVRHGATIVATGGQEYRGSEYGCGTHPRIRTLLEFEELLADWERGREDRQVGNQPISKLPDSIAIILCAGQPAEKYCSRICCATALKNALTLKQFNPAAEVTVLYRDMRTFGFWERLYTEAREQGILFVRYDWDCKPVVTVADELSVLVTDPVLRREIELTPDLLVLAMPMVPSQGAKDLASALKVGVDLDGWFMEAHVKLRPVDFSADGLYLAGAAHYPKFLDESIVQAQAAVTRAMTVLSRDTLEVGGIVAQVESEACVGCLTCVRICPFDVPEMRVDLIGVGGLVGAAYIEPAQCQGCGICVGECPAKAIQLLHYRDEQMEAKIEAFCS
jgi:heterodisulfide reductase subunit A-like polyferredoxin